MAKARSYPPLARASDAGRSRSVYAGPLAINFREIQMAQQNQGSTQQDSQQQDQGSPSSGQQQNQEDRGNASQGGQQQRGNMGTQQERGQAGREERGQEQMGLDDDEALE
jgi:hypothetical protein